MKGWEGPPYWSNMVRYSEKGLNEGAGKGEG